MSDVYIFNKDYKNAFNVVQDILDLDKVILFSSKWFRIQEDSGMFIRLFWNSYLTKYWKQNIEWITNILSCFLDDFRKENKCWFITFFLQDIKKKTITEQDIIKYKDFYFLEGHFYKNKEFDEFVNPWESKNKEGFYTRAYTKVLLGWLPLFDYNVEFWWCMIYTNWYAWVVSNYGDKKLWVFNGKVRVPWRVIEGALRNYAQSILRECENTFREELWVPKIGEWWISETGLFHQLKQNFPNEKVIHHWRPPRLGRQHIDIYFPERDIWLEYQWKQHIEPVEYFWWIESYEQQKKRDEDKAKKCKENWCVLLYVYEWYNLEDVISQILLLF
jgi:hypothetical protein